ncbi:MAG: tRNA lysidine(34) synthetase TilS [Bacteroidales bacterium]|nr:tRNA lysidine(34) synthetase TilS [Bacteroidales bacterium]
MLLVAVSGGIDSMCLAEKVRLEGGPFAIAHCNFCLRGSDSDGDEAFVKAWASSYGITCHVKSFDTLDYATAEGISVEMAARRLRYHWFGELCREHGYSGVAVAHNANDNAETLILNLLRGTGVRGLLGMKVSGFIPDPDFADIPLLRPLLGMTREDIEAFAAEHGLSWREDRTNSENDYKRNKIRNLVFPVFREINPRFVEVLNRDMERISDEVNVSVIPSEARGSHTKTDWDTLGLRPRYDNYTLTEEPWDGTQPVKQPSGVLILDADKAGEYVEGTWEQGDWIKPLGAPGRKKMQDWFTDHHIPADEKPFIPLLKSARDPHHVLAVIPYCIDNSVKVTSHTKRIIRILSAAQ